MPNDKPRRYLGKYREIVLAVVCFLIFDITVLSLNFYISFQLSDSAAAINLAGRQRMLSQRMTKELLAAKLESQQSIGTANSYAIKCNNQQPIWISARDVTTLASRTHDA
jgi:nitrate/nitrite-specific signal transduction histidine kinase